MTKTTMDLTELLQKHDQGDLLRSIAEAVLQLMMESDVDGLIGAGRHERAEQRTTWRNGYRDRSLDTRLGTLNLKVPKLPGQLFPRLSRSPQNLGAGAGCCDPGGVDRRRLDPPRRRAGAGHGAEWHLEKHGVQAVQGYR